MSWNEKKGDNITIQEVGTVNDLIFNAGCCGGFSITNTWGAIDITDSTTTTTTGDITDKGGGDGCGNKLCDSAPYPTNPCKNGVGVTYNFSYTSIDIIDVKVDEEGNIVSILTGLNQRAQQRLIDAGFSKEQRAMVGVALADCYFNKGGTMLGCTSKICSDGTCGFSCNCNDNRNTNYDTCDMCL